jgi:hypothetical protein
MSKGGKHKLKKEAQKHSSPAEDDDERQFTIELEAWDDGELQQIKLSELDRYALMMLYDTNAEVVCNGVPEES